MSDEDVGDFVMDDSAGATANDPQQQGTANPAAAQAAAEGSPPSLLSSADRGLPVTMPPMPPLHTGTFH